MAKQDKSKLKDWFTTGKYPTQEQFWDWMDSYIHRDDQLRITANFPELDGVLQQKVDKEVFKHHFENDNNPHNVTKQQVGLGSVDNTMDIEKPVSMATQTALDLKADKEAVVNHLKDDTNPHKVTKQQVGLGKADNTADLDKPVSRETQTALYLKADRADLNRHLMNDTNPHQVTKVQVGLGHVDDTADVDKPISTATQTALDLKADKTYVNEQVSSLVNGSPELLDTLKELSAAIGDDANFAATLSTKLGNKLDKTAPLAGEVTGDYTNVVLNETAVTSKALTNLVIPKIADPIVSTDKLIDALGKLQAQLNQTAAQVVSSATKASTATHEDRIAKLEKGQFIKGMIMAWKGSTNTIPTGWKLCQELKDKFILGSGDDFKVGATGGARTHQLKESEMPAHEHNLAPDLLQQHYVVGGGFKLEMGQWYSHRAATTNSSFSTGGSQPHNNMPPFYALAYIEYVGLGNSAA